jgi:hypothetical protein
VLFRSGINARRIASTELYSLAGNRIQGGAAGLSAGVYLLLGRGVQGEIVRVRRIVANH